MLHLHPITDLCRLSAVWWRKWLTFVRSLPSPHLYEMHLKAGEKEGRWTPGKILYATNCSSQFYRCRLMLNKMLFKSTWWLWKEHLPIAGVYNFCMHWYSTMPQQSVSTWQSIARVKHEAEIISVVNSSIFLD